MHQLPDLKKKSHSLNNYNEKPLKLIITLLLTQYNKCSMPCFSSMGYPDPDHIVEYNISFEMRHYNRCKTNIKFVWQRGMIINIQYTLFLLYAILRRGIILTW